MRQAAASASAGGVNLAFLGANACYRQIRLQSTSVGPNRLEVCYKDAAEDPIAQQQPDLTTVNWNQAPLNQPESTLIGSMYQSVGAKADMVVTDASSWFYDGCNLADGQAFPTVILGEYDRYVPSLPGPHNTDVLAHSPVPGQSNWSDITYYTAPGKGGGVLATGSASFVSLLGTTGVIPPNVIVPAIPGRDRRHPPRHGERLRPLRARSRHLVRQLERQLGGRLHRCRRLGGDRCRHPLRLSLPFAEQRRRLARPGACHHFGAPTPVRSTPSDGRNRPPNVPGCDTRSPGACWRPQDSPGCS